MGEQDKGGLFGDVDLWQDLLGPSVEELFDVWKTRRGRKDRAWVDHDLSVAHDLGELGEGDRDMVAADQDEQRGGLDVHQKVVEGGCVGMIERSALGRSKRRVQGIRKSLLESRREVRIERVALVEEVLRAE